MQAYSQDLRERVLRALDRGERPAEIARRFEVGRVWVYQVRDRLQKTGKRGSFQIGGHCRSRLADMEPLLRGWIKETADLTLVQMQDRLAKQGVRIKIGALWHQLNRWKLTFKKTPCTPASKSARTCRQRDAHGWKQRRAGRSKGSCFLMKPGLQPT